jgi:predicted aspartyl protease
MMKTAIAAFLMAAGTLVSLSGCEADTGPAAVMVPADSAAGEVDFQLSGPGGAALLVPVHINGEGPFDFVLDTGATLICLDARLIERLSVPIDTRRSGIGAGIEGTGQIQLVRLDSVRIGAAQANELSACVLDLAHTDKLGIEMDGLVGLNFLREFRMTLDFERNVLILQ